MLRAIKNISKIGFLKNFHSLTKVEPTAEIDRNHIQNKVTDHSQPLLIDQVNLESHLNKQSASFFCKPNVDQNDTSSNYATAPNLD